VLIVLGVMHLLNLYVLNRMRRRTAPRPGSAQSPWVPGDPSPQPASGS
jgi:hypothetical protein